MAMSHHPYLALALAVLLTLTVVTGAQALADTSAPQATQLSQSRVIGQAGFAYLGGLRVFLAGVLYGRIDPQWHQYGDTNGIEDRLDLVASFRLIQALNPQMEMPYYYVSYVLLRRGKTEDALNLAREGIANNPTSGLLRANYVQLLMIENKKANLPEMLEQTRIGLGPDMTYTSADNAFESYGVFGAVYLIAGDEKMARTLHEVQEKLVAEGKVSQEAQSKQSGLLGLIEAWKRSATNEDAHGHEHE